MKLPSIKCWSWVEAMLAKVRFQSSIQHHFHLTLSCLKTDTKTFCLWKVYKNAGYVCLDSTSGHCPSSLGSCLWMRRNHPALWGRVSSSFKGRYTCLLRRGGGGEKKRKLLHLGSQRSGSFPDVSPTRSWACLLTTYSLGAIRGG